MYRVHIRDKRTVGERLALSGLDLAYHIPRYHQGPYPSYMERGTNKTLTIEYDNNQTHLQIRNKTGFEVKNIYINAIVVGSLVL